MSTAVDIIRRMASDPAEFFRRVLVPSARGPVPLGSIMADFQRDLFTAIAPSLVAVVRREPPAVPRFWLERTKGASKSRDVGLALLWLLAFAPRRLAIEVGAADQLQAHEVQKAIQDLLDLNPWLASRVTPMRFRLLCKATGAALDIIAADAMSSHGSRPDVVFIDELVHVTDEQFASTLADNSSKIPHNLLIVATNAGQLGTWQERWRDVARTSPRWFFQAVTTPAPWLDERELSEAKRRNPPSRYARLWQGVWVPAGVGDAIPSDDLEAAVTMPGPQLVGESGWGYVAGLDLGVKRDRSAFVVLGAQLGTGRVRLCESRHWVPAVGRAVDLESIRHEILALRDRFQFGWIHCDMWQAVHLQQLLARDGLQVQPVGFGPAGQAAAAVALLTAFRDRRIELYRDEAMLRDLSKLSIVERLGGLKIEAPRGADGHADAAFALAACLPAALEAAGESPIEWSDGIGRNLLDFVHFRDAGWSRVERLLGV